MLLYSKYVWKLLLVTVKSHIAVVKLINVLTFDFGIFSMQSETYYSCETGFNPCNVGTEYQKIQKNSKFCLGWKGHF